METSRSMSHTYSTISLILMCSSACTWICCDWTPSRFASWAFCFISLNFGSISFDWLFASRKTFNTGYKNGGGQWWPTGWDIIRSSVWLTCFKANLGHVYHQNKVKNLPVIYLQAFKASPISLFWSSVSDSTITVGRFIFSSILIVLVRFFFLRTYFSNIPV